MQCGFAMLCAGSVRQKNVKNIMLKNILDACGGAIGFFILGYGLSNGTGGKFVGADGFALASFESGNDYIAFFFQFAFAATAATIVAGTIAERCKMQAYIAYSLFLTAFVYPVVVHAIWNENGFLSANNTNPLFSTGMIDFAGSGVVHMTGGGTALVAAVILGPRIGRFYDEEGNDIKDAEFPPHSVALQVLGTFILWFGWYGFNPGSTLTIVGSGDVAALCAVTTTLSAASGCVSAMFTDTLVGLYLTGEAKYDLTMAMNGILSGLVGITAGCAVVEPWASMLIGITSGWIYVGASKLLVKLKIDDAVDAVPVHFFNGVWGCVATGLFAEPSRIAKAFSDTGHAGWFYEWGKGSGDASLLLSQLIGILFIIGWTVGIMTPFFLVLKRLNMFRVDPDEEKVGQDIVHHKGSAYDLATVDQADIDELYEMRVAYNVHGEEPPLSQDAA